MDTLGKEEWKLKRSQQEILQIAHVLLFLQHTSSEAKKADSSKGTEDRGYAVYNPQ